MRTFFPFSGVMGIALLLPHADGWWRVPALCAFMAGVALLLREVGRE